LRRHLSDEVLERPGQRLPSLLHLSLDGTSCAGLLNVIILRDELVL
jgi:hypothetical protein